MEKYFVLRMDKACLTRDGGFIYFPSYWTKQGPGAKALCLMFKTKQEATDEMKKTQVFRYINYKHVIIEEVEKEFSTQVIF